MNHPKQNDNELLTHIPFMTIKNDFYALSVAFKACFKEFALKVFMVFIFATIFL
nr:MAG: hypothetical protein [Bacteriophage sp.]